MISLWLAFGCEKPKKTHYYAYINKADVNARSGASQTHPVRFKFNNKGLPVLVVTEFDAWHEIQDFENKRGWVHKANLCQNGRQGLVMKNTNLYENPDEATRKLASIEKDCLVSILKINTDWCYVRITHHYQDVSGRIKERPYKGWIKRCDIWGIDKTES